MPTYTEAILADVLRLHKLWQRLAQEWQRYDQEWQRYDQEWQRLAQEWQRLAHTWETELLAQIRALVPDLPWNGKALVFPEGDSDA